VALPDSKREPRSMTLAMSYQTLDSALKQVAEFVDRPIVADGTLGGNIKLQVQNAQPSVAVSALATQLGAKLVTTDDAYVLTAR
jgi:hypothetical protein